jgi:hypothetical protein
MTTIAWRGNTLAADTLATFSSHRDGYITKIAKRRQYLASGSGSAAGCIRFLDWFRRGMVGAAPDMGTKENYAYGRIYCPNGLILCLSIDGWEHVRSEYYACGTGADYCYGAMAMGASAEEAVRAALKFETLSGGEITVLRHYD